MIELNILSPSQQVAEFLRSEIMQETWVDAMPGAPQLSADLGIDRKTIDAAMQLLENEGWLIAQGAGRRRKINLLQKPTVKSLRIAFLMGEEADCREHYVLNSIHALNEAGHTAFFPAGYLNDLGMDLKKVERLVKNTNADAWVVLAASREVLEWFTQQPTATFAIFGRRHGMSIASGGPEKVPVVLEMTRKLIGLKHKRIVMMVRPRRRLPTLGTMEVAFLAELSANGLPVSDYNLPSWEETVEGFHARLSILFDSAPPTALIVDEIQHLVAALQFLAARRLRVPEDVSLICTDYSPMIDWCDPPITHIRWDTRPMVRRVVRWADNVSRGKEDVRQNWTPAEFFQGGTIAPARGS